MPTSFELKPVSLTQGKPSRITSSWLSLPSGFSGTTFEVNISGGSLFKNGQLVSSSSSLSLSEIRSGALSVIADGSQTPVLKLRLPEGDWHYSPIKFSSVNQAPKLEQVDFGSLPVTGKMLVRPEMFTLSDSDSPLSALEIQALGGTTGQFFVNGVKSSRFQFADVQHGIVFFELDGRSSKPAIVLKASDQQASSATIKQALTPDLQASPGTGQTLSSLHAKSTWNLTEGRDFQLSSKLFSEIDALADKQILVKSASHCQIGQKNSAGEFIAATSFSLADLKSGKLIVRNDGGNELPELQLQVSGEHTVFQASIKYATLNDKPELALKKFLINSAETVVLKSDFAQVSDEETTSELKGAFYYSLSKVKGLTFHLNGATVKSFSQSDVDHGLVTVKQSGPTSEFSVIVRDPSGATSSVVKADIRSHHDVTGDIQIQGSPFIAKTLSVASNLSDADGMGTLSYLWKNEAGEVLGHESTLILDADDLAHRIAVTVSFTDGNGTIESKTTALSDLVSYENHKPAGVVRLKGFSAVGETLQAEASLVDVDGLGDISWQWLRDGVAINGAVEASLQLSESDVGSSIGVRLKYLDLLGHEEALSATWGAGIAAQLPSSSEERVEFHRESSLKYSSLSGGVNQAVLVLDADLDLSTERSHLVDFDVIDLGSQNLTLKISSSDVLAITDEYHSLIVTGSHGQVDLESGWLQYSAANGYTTYAKDDALIKISDALVLI